MLEGPLAPGQQQRTIASNLTRRWAGSIGLAAAVGLAYFLAALLSYDLSLQSEGLAVFWPASGVSSGLLIALGSRARWPVVSGVIVAVVADHLMLADPSPHCLPSGGTARRVSRLGLVMIGIIVFISVVLWQHGPSFGTLILLPLLLICPLMHFLMHRQTHGSHLGS